MGIGWAWVVVMLWMRQAPGAKFQVLGARWWVLAAGCYTVHGTQYAKRSTAV